MPWLRSRPVAGAGGRGTGLEETGALDLGPHYRSRRATTSVRIRQGRNVLLHADAGVLGSMRGHAMTGATQVMAIPAAEGVASGTGRWRLQHQHRNVPNDCVPGAVIRVLEWSCHAQDFKFQALRFRSHAPCTSSALQRACRSQLAGQTNAATVAGKPVSKAWFGLAFDCIFMNCQADC